MYAHTRHNETSTRDPGQANNTVPPSQIASDACLTRTFFKNYAKAGYDYMYDTAWKLAKQDPTWRDDPGSGIPSYSALCSN